MWHSNDMTRARLHDYFLELSVCWCAVTLVESVLLIVEGHCIPTMLESSLTFINRLMFLKANALSHRA